MVLRYSSEVKSFSPKVAASGNRVLISFVELETFSDEQIALADANGDGEITVSDATYLQMVLAQ